MDAGVDDVLAFVFAGATDAGVFSEHAGAQRGESREGFDCRAWWKRVLECESLVDDGAQASGLWIQYDDRALASGE
jgi:hypothetical protein